MNENRDTLRIPAPYNSLVFSALGNLERDPSRLTKDRLRAVLSFAYLINVNDVPIPEAVAEYAATIVRDITVRLGIELPNNGEIEHADQIEQVVAAATNVPDDPAISEDALSLLS